MEFPKERHILFTSVATIFLNGALFFPGIFFFSIFGAKFHEQVHTMKKTPTRKYHKKARRSF